jgi:hypothetical protein
VATFMRSSSLLSISANDRCPWGDEIRQFQLDLLKEKKLAPGTVEGWMSALRYLYRKVLKRRDIAYDDWSFRRLPGSCRSC